MNATSNNARTCCSGIGFALCAALVVGCVVFGCGGGEPGANGRTARGTSSVGGQVVSTVNGNPITLAEVSDLVAAGLSANEALKRLQAERLLAAEAQRRGMQSAWEVAEVARKAAVQAFLEHENALTVSQAELEASFAKQQTRFEKPELRGAVHLLASMNPKKVTPETEAAARALAEKLAPELEHAEDIDEFIHTYNRAVIDGIHLVVQRIPPMAQHGKLAESFADAMFSIAQPGMVPEVVRSPYGWHAIRVTEIVPPNPTPKEEAFKVLRKELLLEQQKRHTQELLARLAETYPVQLSGDVAKTLNGLVL